MQISGHLLWQTARMILSVVCLVNTHNTHDYISIVKFVIEAKSSNCQIQITAKCTIYGMLRWLRLLCEKIL